jgi:hypothetical protein
MLLTVSFYGYGNTIALQDKAGSLYVYLAGNCNQHSGNTNNGTCTSKYPARLAQPTDTPARQITPPDTAIAVPMLCTL